MNDNVLRNKKGKQKPLITMALYASQGTEIAKQGLKCQTPLTEDIKNH